MNLLKNIHTLEQYEIAIKNKAILVFSTTWCPDCHFLNTFIDDLVGENMGWTFYYIDRDEMLDLCIELDVMGIPSFIAYNNKQEVGRLVSKLRKSKEQIQLFIDGLE